jgi:opacity protein-like surface antigen
MMFDYAFMKLGDDLTGPRGGVTDVTVRQGVLEAMAVRRIQVEEGILDVYGGIRWWDNDVKITLDPAILPGDREAKVAADWVDPVVGVRYRMPLSEAWALLLQGDIGGLSLGSDLTFAAVVGVNYRFSDTMSLNLKYKGLWVDYEDGKASEPGYFMYDTVTHGLILGLNFEF